MTGHPILQRMVRKFELRELLDDADRSALLSLPYQIKTAEAGAYIVREGAPTEKGALILSGLAFRHKLTADGGRQIVSIRSLDSKPRWGPSQPSPSAIFVFRKPT